MSMPSEKHDRLVDNVAKVLTTVVIALGIAVVVAMIVATF